MGSEMCIRDRVKGIKNDLKRVAHVRKISNDEVVDQRVVGKDDVPVPGHPAGIA